MSRRVDFTADLAVRATLPIQAAPLPHRLGDIHTVVRYDGESPTRGGLGADGDRRRIVAMIGSNAGERVVLRHD